MILPEDEKDKEPPKPISGDDPNVGYYLVVDGKAVQIFKFNKESFEYYAQILNKYREKLGSSVKIYSMIPPPAGEFLRLRNMQVLPTRRTTHWHFGE